MRGTIVISILVAVIVIVTAIVLGVYFGKTKKSKMSTPTPTNASGYTGYTNVVYGDKAWETSESPTASAVAAPDLTSVATELIAYPNSNAVDKFTIALRDDPRLAAIKGKSVAERQKLLIPNLGKDGPIVSQANLVLLASACLDWSKFMTNYKPPTWLMAKQFVTSIVEMASVDDRLKPLAALTFADPLSSEASAAVGLVWGKEKDVITAAFQIVKDFLIPASLVATTPIGKLQVSDIKPDTIRAPSTTIVSTTSPSSPPPSSATVAQVAVTPVSVASTPVPVAIANPITVPVAAVVATAAPTLRKYTAVDYRIPSSTPAQLGSPINNTVTNCSTACDNMQGCVGFSRPKGVADTDASQACWFKSSLDAQYRVAGDPAWWTWVKP
jgi:hypothetical protein